jgi:hypothetical protein
MGPLTLFLALTEEKRNMHAKLHLCGMHCMCIAHFSYWHALLFFVAAGQSWLAGCSAAATT